MWALGCIFPVIYQSRKWTRPICIEGVFLAFLTLLNILTASIVYGILCYNYFSLLPVHLEVVIFQLYKTEDDVLLTQAQDYKKSLLGVQLLA